VVRLNDTGPLDELKAPKPPEKSDGQEKDIQNAKPNL
jgi:hypothetical protein